MPHNEPDPVDPMTLHGVMVETEDDTALWDMTDCFIEEYARMGHDEEHILSIFRSRFYTGPHLAYLSFGEPAVRERISRYFDRRGPLRSSSKGV